MNLIKYIITILLVLVAVLSCDFNVAGGGTDQPNTISGEVVAMNGKPAIGSTVVLRRGNFNPSIHPDSISNSEVIASTQTNSLGKFSFNHNQQGQYYLEVLAVDSTEIAITSNFILKANSPQLIKAIGLQKSAKISTRVVYTKGSLQKISLAGTHYQANPDSLGNVNYFPIPAGSYNLVTQLPNSTKNTLISSDISVNTGETKLLPTIYIDSNKILFFDFNRNSNQNLFYSNFTVQPLPTKGNWFSYPTFELNGFNQTRSVKITDNGQNGFDIGEGFYNFSKMDTLVFYAKGPAKIVVHFHTQIIQDREGSLGDTVEITTSNWGRFGISNQDIHVPPFSVAANKGITWTQASTNLQRITFQSLDGQDFLLDSIYTVGATAKDLVDTIP